ncbi:unnamed protein product [Durusdinium trenchii]|uniref:Centrosomal protein of 70 kDa n=1 Tax=Durusdinium trenchii TaxID=1381693 RepID=A0ABP0LYU6_9DINO
MAAVGLSSTLNTPVTPAAAAAFDLLRPSPLARTAPAAPSPPGAPTPGGCAGARDDQILGKILSKGPAPGPPGLPGPPRPAPAPAPAAPAAPASPAAAAALATLGATPAVNPPPLRPPPAPSPAAAPSRPAPPGLDLDAKVVGNLIAASPKAHQDPSVSRDAGVLDSFLRKHAPGPEAFVRRKPAPLTNLDTPTAQDDAMLHRLLERGAGRPGADAPKGRSDGLVRFSLGQTSPKGGYPVDDKPGPLGNIGYPVAYRRSTSHSQLVAGRARSGAKRSGANRGKVRTNIIEERAKDDLQEENLQLRRAQVEMKTRLQKLQVQIRNAQEEPKDTKAFEQKASEVEELQRALSAPGRAKASTSPGARRGVRSRQPQRRFPGRLRGRMTAMPFGQGYGGELRPSSPVRAGVLPALHIQPELSPSRQSRPGSPAGRLSPQAESRRSASPRAPERPLPPPSFDVKEPMPAHTLGSWMPPPFPSPKGSKALAGATEVEQHIANQNKMKEDELKQRNQDLRKQLDELLVQQVTADHYSEKQKSRYKEKTKAQEAKIKALESALERQRDKVRHAEGALQHDKQKLEIDVAVLATELHHARVPTSQDDGSELRLQLAQAHASAEEMKRQIRDITKFAFSSSTEQRMISEQRMKELEDLLGKKTEESEQLQRERQEIDAECAQVRVDVADLEQQSRRRPGDDREMVSWRRRCEAQLLGAEAGCGKPGPESRRTYQRTLHLSNELEFVHKQHARELSAFHIVVRRRIGACVRRIGAERPTIWDAAQRVSPDLDRPPPEPPGLSTGFPWNTAGHRVGKAWAFVISARVELGLFLAALLDWSSDSAHFLLFGNSTPSKSKRSKDPDLDLVERMEGHDHDDRPEPNPYAARDVELAFSDASRSNNARQAPFGGLRRGKDDDHFDGSELLVRCEEVPRVHRCPSGADALTAAHVVEAMQRFKKARGLRGEISAYLAKHRSSVQRLAVELVVGHDSDFVAAFLKSLPAGFALDSRSYEILMNMHFTMRNFEKVDELVAEAKAKKAAPVGRSSAMAPLGTMQGQSAPQCSR